MIKTKNDKIKLDSKFREIIILLQQNCRLSIREIAKKLFMKPTSVYNRIKKLEENGFIKGYSAIISRDKMGYSVLGIVLISYKKGELSQKVLAEKLSKFPQVQDVFIVSGEWDIILKVIEKDVNSLGEFITEKLRKIPEIDKTETMIVLNEIKSSLTVPA
ncbi:MAG: Lrp/AsnC family transcriptional regulator [Candidatus Woesearchaeota archaeon]